MPLLFFCLYLLVSITGYILQALNLQHLRAHGTEVPQGFEHAVNSEALAKATAYTLDQSRVGLIESACDSGVLLLFLYGGLLSWYDSHISSLGFSFALSGVLFFLGLVLFQTIFDIPFNLFTTFRIEQRYGFNTMTFRLWIADFFKSTTIALLLVSAVTAGALYLVKLAPHSWWLWVWLFFAFVSIFLMYLSPYVIEPLFFKFNPITEEGLEEEIRALMGKADLQIGKVLQVDASRRSRHSNAYFTGIGRVKRIVLYDTLLQQMTHREILAVLAHEVGHWKKGHIWKRLVMTELGALVASYLAYLLINWGGLPGLLGLKEVSFAGQLVILGFLSSILTFPLTPLGSWLSRRQERQADDYATELAAMPDALATALIKLSAENLSNLHPHPLYAKFYYSHPPAADRVRYLLQLTNLPAPGSGNSS